MLTIRKMTHADVPLGLRLKSQAGWNQTEADWHRMLNLAEDGGLIAELDGIAVGTCITCTFESVAWIAMVLVDAGVRRQGVGTALMTHAVAALEDRGVRTIRLDATPLGQPVYEKLGFIADYPLERFAGTLPASSARPTMVQSADLADWPELVALDRRITGTNRERLVRALFTDNPRAFVLARKDGQVLGYAVSRPGSQAVFLGPCLAREDAGVYLLNEMRLRHGGAYVFMDVPLANVNAVRWAELAGLTRQRRLMRMHRGDAIGENIAEMWASSGPELG